MDSWTALLEQYWRRLAKLISFGDDNTERQMVSAKGLFSGNSGEQQAHSRMSLRLFKQLGSRNILKKRTCLEKMLNSINFLKRHFAQSVSRKHGEEINAGKVLKCFARRVQ